MQLTGALRGALFVLLAALLWGTLGLFYKWTTATFDLTPLTIVFWRATLAALCLGVVLGGVLPAAGRGWGALQVRRADLPLFIAYGVLGVTAFYLFYIYAVLLVGVTVAVVLLYTAPAFVTVMAWRFLGEGFGLRKGVALILTLLGCVFVARAYDPALLQLNVVGILCGLASAFTYALYSILGKFSLRRGYPIATMSLYVYSIGALGLLIVALVSGPEQLVSMGTRAEVWLLLAVLALAQTLGALSAYTAGLRYLEAGLASILATFEPVVAMFLAYFLLDERVEWLQLVGVGLILGAVLLLQIGRRAVKVVQLASE